MEDLIEIETALQKDINKLNRLCILGKIIQTDGPSYATMEALEFIYPGCLSEEAPLNTYTVRPSQTNKGYALEAIDYTITAVALAIRNSLTNLSIASRYGFSKVIKEWHDFINSVKSYKTLKLNEVQLDSLNIPMDVNAGQTYQTPLNKLYGTHLDYLILTHHVGYSAYDLLQTTIAHATVLQRCLDVLDTIFENIIDMYKTRAYGSELIHLLENIAKVEPYMNCIQYSRTELYEEIKEAGGFKPETTVDTESAVFIPGDNNNFWQGTYISKLNRHEITLSPPVFNYSMAINKENKTPLFTNGLLPDLNIDTAKLESLLHSLHSEASTLVSKFISVKNKAIKLNDKITNYETKRAQVWAGDTRYIANAIVWPKANVNHYSETDEKDYYSNQFTAAMFPRVIIVSPFIFTRVKAISTVIGSAKDIYTVSKRLFTMTELYADYLKSLQTKEI